MGNYKEALQYHHKARSIHESINDNVGMAVDYRNIGNVHYRMGGAKDYYNIGIILLSNTDDKEEALKSLSNALTILQELENWQRT
jgi:tetratricopeptide (TPR) repeat protein